MNVADLNGGLLVVRWSSLLLKKKKDYATNINPFKHESAKFKTEELNFVLKNCQNQTVCHDSTAQ